MTADSSATQATRSSRTFQINPSTPPGRSTLATSTDPSAASTQCHDWPNVTASTLGLGGVTAERLGVPQIGPAAVGLG